MGKYRVYLKSGQVVTFHAEKVTMTISGTTGEYTGYSIQGMARTVGFNVTQIAAWEEI